MFSQFIRYKCIICIFACVSFPSIVFAMYVFNCCLDEYILFIKSNHYIYSNCITKKNKTIQNREDIIGQYGEGMKLAALAILREPKSSEDGDTEIFQQESRSLMIDSAKQRWLFMLDKDSGFNDKICLFFKLTSLSEDKMKNLGMKEKYTYTRIGGITIDEWNDQYKNFLFLSKKSEIRPIHIQGDDAEHKGSILLEKPFRGKLFVKELHTMDYKSYDVNCPDSSDSTSNNRITGDCVADGDYESFYYGYNVNEIAINRDRMLFVVYIYIVFC